MSPTVVHVLRFAGFAVLFALACVPAVLAYRLPSGQPWDTLEWTTIGLYIAVFAYAAYRTIRHRS